MYVHARVCAELTCDCLGLAVNGRIGGRGFTCSKNKVKLHKFDTSTEFLVLFFIGPAAVSRLSHMVYAPADSYMITNGNECLELLCMCRDV